MACTGSALQHPPRACTLLDPEVFSLQARAEAAADEVAVVRERAQALMAEKDAQIAAVKVFCLPRQWGPAF